MKRPRDVKPSLGHIAAALAIGAVLVLTLAAYLSPHMVVDLANRVWSCF